MTGREEILQIYYNTNFHAKKQNKKYHILTTLLLFSHKVVSDFLQTHARLPCSSLSLRICSNSPPLSW